jgi:hypothetical protein
MSDARSSGRKWIFLGAFTALGLLLFFSCEKAATKLQEEAGIEMTFTGQVNRAGSTKPVAGAVVNLIPLLNLEAIKELIEYKKIPDGNGGEADRVRIKLDKVQAYIDAGNGVITGASSTDGTFSIKAPLNAYLVYTHGPGTKPGAAADSYGAHFWGVNAETGELTLDDLIGSDKKLAQANTAIQLSGGPVPPPVPGAPEAALPPPPESAEAPESPPATQEEPTTETSPDDLPAGNIIPQEGDTTFWESITLTYDGGTLATGAALEVDAAPVAADQTALMVEGVLKTAQTEPVVLVVQKGFDSAFVADCAGTETHATTRIYPASVNGTKVSFELVPPGPFYKLYLAKSATQKELGSAPDAEEIANPSDVLTVGKRTCANAKPTNPFQATLTWDKQVDLDLYVAKYDAAKVEAATTEDEIGQAVVDQTNWTRLKGDTLSLDANNIYGYGPETASESASETSPESYCYLVRANYNAGSGATKLALDVSFMKTEDATTKVVHESTGATMDTVGQWESLGAFGPGACAKLMSPLPDPANIITYPTSDPADLTSGCTTAPSCSLDGNKKGQYEAVVTLAKDSFASGETITVNYSGMPGLSGDWITITPKTFTDQGWCTWQWSSGESGTQYYGGMPAGTYEVRMYYGWSGGQCEVIARKEFTVK